MTLIVHQAYAMAGSSSQAYQMLRTVRIQNHPQLLSHSQIVFK
ncbi:MAG: hypothetical protein ACUVS3_08610 [Thermodesulfobacteriota bacterium]